MAVRMPAARSALRVLQLMSEQVGPMRAATVARELGLPRSSTYQLLQVMREEGFLVHYPELGSFGPSSRVREIGTRVGAATRLERLAQPVLDRLVSGAPVPVTAHLAVLAGSDVAYAARARSERSPATVSLVGVRLPASTTATGRSLLAALTAEQVRAQLGGSRELARVLHETRQRGWATEVGDVDPQYSSVAAVAWDASSAPAASVGVTFRSDVPEDPWPQLGALVQAAAADLSARLGGRGPQP